MVEDEVLFTPHLATVIVALHRNISQVLDDCCGISLMEFCFLASIVTHGGTMSISDFPSSMGSGPNTIVAAASRLHRKGFVEKSRSLEDKRIALFHNTDKGEAALTEGYEQSYRHLKSTVWKNHTDQDIDEIMHSFHPSTKSLGISEKEVHNLSHPVMTPAYFMFIIAIIHRWTQDVKNYAGLSLTEFRCLAILGARPHPLNCSKISEALMLDRSSITSVVSSLQRKGYVSIKKREDKRNNQIALTEKGEVSTALINAKLARATADIYSGVNPELKAKTNELHMRMYGTYTL